jgi:hypothetical protein
VLEEPTEVFLAGDSLRVLNVMKKPDIDNFGDFAKQFKKASDRAGKPKQLLLLSSLRCAPGAGPVTCTLLGQTRSHYHAASPSILSR